LANRESIIIENAFITDFAKPELDKLIRKHKPLVLEIYCITDSVVRRQRYKQRSDSGNRHSVHVNVEEHLLISEPKLNEKYAPLNVGKIIKVDTTELSKINFSEVLSQVKNLY